MMKRIYNRQTSDNTVNNHKITQLPYINYESPNNESHPEILSAKSSNFNSKISRSIKNYR